MGILELDFEPDFELVLLLLVDLLLLELVLLLLVDLLLLELVVLPVDFEIVAAEVDLMFPLSLFDTELFAAEFEAVELEAVEFEAVEFDDAAFPAAEALFDEPAEPEEADDSGSITDELLFSETADVDFPLSPELPHEAAQAVIIRAAKHTQRIFLIFITYTSFLINSLPI